MLFSKKGTIIAHLAGWILFLSLIISFVAGSGGFFLPATIDLLSLFVFTLMYMALFYLNAELIFPKLYLSQKQTVYFLILAILLFAFFFLQPFDHLMRHPFPRFRQPLPFETGPPPLHGRHGAFPAERGRPRIDIISIILFFMVWSVSTALAITKQWRISQQRAARAEAERVHAELSFLKSQINPHFLFNTLNSIYVLSLSQHSKTPDAILKLSNIMRYLTDEASQEYVPIESEVSCEADYIDLQRLRLSEKVHIGFFVEGDMQNKMMAPLLFMSFIENAFKYGISNHEVAQITIKIAAAERSVSLFCQNTVFATERRTERTGIGISNTRRRLEYLYAGRHQLEIKAGGDHYTVHLTLQA